MNIYTQRFQDIAKELEQLAEKDSRFATNKEMQNLYLEQKGVDPDEFSQAYGEYIDKLEEGQTDFRSAQPELGDNIVADSIENVVGSVARFTGRTVGEYADYLKLLGVELPDSALKYLDPYHGDTLLSDVENFGGQIASFIGPGLGLKAANTAIKLGKYGKHFQKAFAKKPAKWGAVGTTFAAHEAIINNSDISAIEDILEDEEAAETLQKLEDNPEDREASNYLKNFLINLGYEGAFIGGGFALGKFYKNVFKKSRFGNRIISLTKKHFTTRRGLDTIEHERLLMRNEASRASLERARGVATSFQKSIKKNDKKLVEKYENAFPTRKKRNEEEILNDALAGDTGMASLLSGQSKKLLTEMRGTIDDLSEHLSNKVFTGKLSLKVDENKEMYLNRSYRIFDDPVYRTAIKRAADRYLKSENFNKIKNAEVSKAPNHIKKNLREQLNDEEKIIQDAYDFIKEDYPYLTDSGAQDQLMKFLKRSDHKEQNAFFDLVTQRDALLSSSKTFKEKKKVPAQIRALWGEVKSPYQKYVNTFSKLSVMKAEHKFTSDLATRLEGLAAKGEGAAFVSATKPLLTETGDRPWVSLQKVAEERAKAVFGPNAFGKPIEQEAIEKISKNPNLTPAQKLDEIEKIKELHESYIKNPEAKKLYISPEYADILQEITKPPKEGWLYKAADMWMRAKGLSQVTKTVWNPATHGRNTFGNMILMVANGMNPIGGKGFSQAFKSTVARISGRTDKEMSAYLAKMIEYGIADSSVTLGLIKDNLKRFKNEDRFFSKTKRGIGGHDIGTKGKDIFPRAIGAPARLYEGEDFLFKVAHWEKTLAYLKKAFPNETIEELEKMAARRTRDLMPNYKLVPTAFKNLRYMPIGDFVAFPAEMARVTKNLVRYTFEDLMSGNTVLQKQAYKRAGGMTTAALVPDVVQDMSARLMGISEEQVDAIDKASPDYYLNSTNVFFSPIKTDSKGGKVVDMVRFGPTDPFDSIKIAAKGMHEALLSDNINPEIANKVALATLYRTAGPFGGSSMLTDTILELGGMEGRTSEYPRGRYLSDTMKHIARTFDLPTSVGVAAGIGLSVFEPGFLTHLQRIKDYESAEQAARAIDKYMGEDTPEAWSAFMSPIAFDHLPELLGLGVRPFDISGSMYRKLGDPLKEIKKLDSNFFTELQKPNMNPEEYSQFYNEYDNLQVRRADKALALKGMLEYYKKLGLSERDIYLGMTQRGVKDLMKKTGKGYLDTQDWSMLMNILDNTYLSTDFKRNIIDKVIYQTGGRFNIEPLLEKRDAYMGARIE